MEKKRDYVTIAVKKETKEKLVHEMNIKTFDEAINKLLEVYSQNGNNKK